MRDRILLVSLVAATAACDPPAVPPAPAPVPDRPITTCQTPGSRGVLNFALPFSDRVERPLAAGALAMVAMCPRSTAQQVPPIRAARSSDPRVATFVLEEPDNKGRPSLVEVEALQPGAAELILVSDGDQEIDRLPLSVGTATAVDLAGGWGPAPGPTVIAGQRYSLGLGVLPKELAGGGAVRYALRGPLQRLPESTRFALYFSAMPGSGEVLAEAIGARATLPVRVLEAAQVDALELSPAVHTWGSLPGWVASATVYAYFSAGGTTVYGPHCVWSVPSGVKPPRLDVLFVTPQEDLGLPPRAEYVIERTTMDYDATCIGPNGLRAVLKVRWR